MQIELDDAAADNIVRNVLVYHLNMLQEQTFGDIYNPTTDDIKINVRFMDAMNLLIDEYFGT